MTMERGPLSAVPLTSLFRQVPPGDLDHIRRSAAALDRARSGFGTAWDWDLRHARFAGLPAAAGIPVILMVAVVVESTGPDWLEFDLDIEWTPGGLLQLVAAVNIACMCETDHNTHYVDELTMLIDKGTSLGSAFETASRRMISWLQDPHTASWWRAKAGLPSH